MTAVRHQGRLLTVVRNGYGTSGKAAKMAKVVKVAKVTGLAGRTPADDMLSGTRRPRPRG